MYQQTEVTDTPYSWCGVGLSFNLSSNSQEGLNGVFFFNQGPY